MLTLTRALAAGLFVLAGCGGEDAGADGASHGYGPPSATPNEVRATEDGVEVDLVCGGTYSGVGGPADIDLCFVLAEDSLVRAIVRWCYFEGVSGDWCAPYGALPWCGGIRPSVVRENQICTACGTECYDEDRCRMMRATFDGHDMRDLVHAVARYESDMAACRDM